MIGGASVVTIGGDSVVTMGGGCVVTIRVAVGVGFFVGVFWVAVGGWDVRKVAEGGTGVAVDLLASCVLRERLVATTAVAVDAF